MAKSRNGLPLKNGFVNLYKPVGITSMEALRQVKRITGQRNKVGHGGTMDPLAQGVLPVCFGQATRLMDFVVTGRKRYRMEVTLGVSTTTYDAEGETVNTMSVDGVTQEHVEKALPPFVGNIDQLPPVYSALKVQGQRMYKLARAGVEVDRKPRPVEIYDIRLLEFDLPKLVLEVDCGKGAYMRSLAHDLGESLGCGGHVVDLIRLSAGRFHADDSITLLQLEQAVTEDGGWEKHLHPVDWVLKDLRSVSVGKQAENLLRNGQAVSLGSQFMDAAYLESFRAYSSEGRFLALVRFERSANSWRPVKVFQLDVLSPLVPET